MGGGLHQGLRGWSGVVPTISAYTRWNCLATTDASKSRSTPILTSAVNFNGFSVSGQFDAAELIRYMITKPQRRQPDQTHLKLLQMSGDVHPNQALLQSIPVQYVLATSQVVELATSAPNAMDGCNRNALEKVIGPATPARPHSPSNRHHQLDLPLRLPNRSVMTARSTSYISTLTESGTS